MIISLKNIISGCKWEEVEKHDLHTVGKNAMKYLKGSLIDSVHTQFYWKTSRAFSLSDSELG